MRLSNSIEEFIKALILESEGPVELQRNELAVYFQCAPSQINYVLATRFNTEHGYLIESRRGGGGYIRVTPITMQSDDYLLYLVSNQLARDISRQSALRLIARLIERQIINRQQAVLFEAATSDQALSPSAAMRDTLRANILRTMLLAVMAASEENENTDEDE